jgi:endoglucanase
MRAVTAAAGGAMLAALLAVAPPAIAAPRAACTGWPAWQRFASAYLSDDGRVVDRDSPARVTVSEGQAYALLFALVADDRARFERLLTWTANNLADGDLDARLPAWRWGQRTSGEWGVLDPNSAADADLWLAYTLYEAARRWHVPAYRAHAAALAARILREETGAVAGFGRVLLPAPHGFVTTDAWRVNPSYSPLQLVRRLARVDGAAGFRELAADTPRLILATALHGYAPDWSEYRRGAGFGADPSGGATGSWAAIRVYLWAGMLAPGEPARGALLRTLRPMAQLVASRAAPPATVDALTGRAEGTGPSGFSAALVPFLAAEGEPRAAARERHRAQAALPAVLDGGHGYYDAVLTLFGLGFAERRFRFAADGALRLGGDGTCAA